MKPEKTVRALQRAMNDIITNLVELSVDDPLRKQILQQVNHLEDICDLLKQREGIK